MTLEKWISAHPYLRPIAEFHAQVTEAMNHAAMAKAGIPDWPNYAVDYREGLPLLRSSHTELNYMDLERIVASLLEQLVITPLPGPLKRECLDIWGQFQSSSEVRWRAVAALLGNEELAVLHPGLFRHIGWTALVRYLGPLLAAFEHWRDEESWSQPYCPVCGSGPSMSQLVGADSGRRRLLVCSRCETRWSFRRMGCPFCENTSSHRISVLAIEGEKHLRIDYCNSCSGYLKTYDGEGAENVMLADWTSLHLDLLAQDRGLKRLATSLYEI